VRFSDALTHAYLFAGAAGTGKTDAAHKLACRIVCPDCAADTRTCPTCRRIARGLHPDVITLEPEGGEYLIEQIRDLIYRTSLAPIEASAKVYLITDADRFTDQAANAFLKTLEEPPTRVTFILFAHSAGAVIETIRSRCQVVRFVPKPESEMIAELIRETGCDAADARAALAATGSVFADAKQFLTSVARQNTRAEVVRIYQDLPAMTDHEVVAAVKRLQEIIAGPVKELKDAHVLDSKDAADFLVGAALKELEKTHARRERAYERRCYVEVCAVLESLLRDALCRGSGAGALARNDDVRDDSIGRTPAITPGSAARCFAAIRQARWRLGANVNAQLTLEVLLLNLRKECLWRKLPV